MDKQNERIDFKSFSLTNIKTLIFKQNEKTFEIYGTLSDGAPSRKQRKSPEEIVEQKRKYYEGNVNFEFIANNKVRPLLDILVDAITEKPVNDEGFVEVVKHKYYVNRVVLMDFCDCAFQDEFERQQYAVCPNEKQSTLKVLLLRKDFDDYELPILYVNDKNILCRKAILVSGFLSAYFSQTFKDETFVANVPNFVTGVVEEKSYYPIPLRYCSFFAYDHLEGTLKNTLGYTSKSLYKEKSNGVWDNFVLNAYRVLRKPDEKLNKDLLRKIISLTSGAVIIAALNANSESLFNWSEEFVAYLRKYVEGVLNKYHISVDDIPEEVTSFVVNHIKSNIKRAEAKKNAKKRKK